MARQENLTVIKAGLNRQRTKGAALKDTLYDLLNGFVSTEKTVKVRPGTRLTETLPAGTKGLVHWDGGFHVFAITAISPPSGYTVHVIQSPDDATFTISRIHFAEPFMDALYVSAEFSDGSTYHYWLQSAPVWLADTDYNVNQAVSPSVDTGLVYKARRLVGANPAWSENTPRAVDDVVEPTTANNFKYTVTQVVGPTPRSGPTEPIWPTKAGATIVEDLDDLETPVTPPAPTPTLPDFGDLIDEERFVRYRLNLSNEDGR